MGIDLTIYILRESDLILNSWWCYQRLIFDRDYKLFEVFGLPDKGEVGSYPIIFTQTIPKNVELDIYKDDGLKRTRTNNYGEEMEMIPIGNFKDKKFPKSTEYNNSIIKFIQSLPKKGVIILEWS